MSSLVNRGGKAKEGDAKERQLSVIVPAYNEVENIRPLCERLFKAMKEANITTELIVVDDESAGSEQTENIVKELAKESYPIRIKCRKKTEGRGLSSAVLLGFSMAKYDNILCMDADLQHEPESVPNVARPVIDGKAEFSVGSRNVEGGGVGFEWSLFRRIVSHGATLLAWFVASSTDPMSGFFCTTKDVLNRGLKDINSIGFKIGLEIMVRCRCKPVADVAISFQERNAGESKLSAKQYRFYVEQLASLYWAKYGYLLLIFLVLILTVAAFVLSAATRMLMQ